MTGRGDMPNEVHGILKEENNIGSGCNDSPNEQCEDQTIQTPAPKNIL